MIVAHLLKHGQLSFMQQSERHCKLREHYYNDEEFGRIMSEKIGKYNIDDFCSKDNAWNEICNNMSQNDWDEYQKKFRIRQELTNKGSWGLGYTILWMAGWKQDPTQWDNFFNVRLGKGVQKETKELALAMKQLMEETQCST